MPETVPPTEPGPTAAVTVTRCHPLARCEHCRKAASYDVIQQDGTAEWVCGNHIGRAIGRVLYNASEARNGT